MLRLAADEDFNGRIVRGLKRREPTLDLARVQETDVFGAADPEVLAWAAAEDRVLLTHDVSTMTAAAYDRVTKHQPMPGVVEVPQSMPIGLAIDDILLLAAGSQPGEYEGQVLYLPL
ncbi:MAG: DUF5615 family PIN-like protein [Acidobacteriota bacterium]